MQDKDVKEGDIFLFASYDKNRIKDIQFVKVLQEHGRTPTGKNFLVADSSGFFNSCPAWMLFDSIEESLSLARRIAQTKENYDIEYEINATKRIVDKFNNKKYYENILKDIEKRLVPESIKRAYHLDGLFSKSKINPYHEKMKRLQRQLEDYLDWKETNK